MPIRLQLTAKDYEAGVAEILAERFAGKATIEQDARLPSRSGGRPRQIDILVRIPLPGMNEQLMVVDCKRYGKKVDKKDVEMFIGMVEDVGAPLGLLVTTNGYTKGAVARAKAERGIHVEVIPLDELWQWNPPLLDCEVCALAVPEESMPGMAYIDQLADIETEDGDSLEVTVGYCEKCATLYLQCPNCDTTNTVYESRTGEWIECDGGCGLEYYLRAEMTKDDLSNPTHDRVTLRP